MHAASRTNDAVLNGISGAPRARATSSDGPTMIPATTGTTTNGASSRTTQRTTRRQCRCCQRQPNERWWNGSSSTEAGADRQDAERQHDDHGTGRGDLDRRLALVAHHQGDRRARHADQRGRARCCGRPARSGRRAGRGAPPAPGRCPVRPRWSRVCRRASRTPSPPGRRAARAGENMPVVGPRRQQEPGRGHQQGIADQGQRDLERGPERTAVRTRRRRTHRAVRSTAPLRSAVAACRCDAAGAIRTGLRRHARPAASPAPAMFTIQLIPNLSVELAEVVAPGRLVQRHRDLPAVGQAVPVAPDLIGLGATDRDRDVAGCRGAGPCSPACRRPSG